MGRKMTEEGLQRRIKAAKAKLLRIERDLKTLGVEDYEYVLLGTEEEE